MGIECISSKLTSVKTQEEEKEEQKVKKSPFVLKHLFILTANMC